MSRAASNRSSSKTVKFVAAPFEYALNSRRERSRISARNPRTDHEKQIWRKFKMSRFHPFKKSTACFLGSAVVACLVLSATGLAGETITLKNGKTLEGTIAAWNGNRTMVFFQPDNRSLEPQWLSLNEIEHLQLDAAVVHPSPDSTSTKRGRSQNGI